MAEHKANYIPQEDSILQAIIEEAKQEGIPLSTAYIKIAEELQRPVGSVANRHRRLMKKDELGSTPRKKHLSESELLVLKLKSIKRDKERSAEKSNMYKEKYDDLKVDYNDLMKKHQQLQHEHQKLIDTVKEALGESIVEDQAEREVAITSESA